MNNSSRKKQFGMNIGSASILLVFVILCLVSLPYCPSSVPTLIANSAPVCWNVPPLIMPLAIRQNNPWQVWIRRCNACMHPVTAKKPILWR